MNYNNADLVDRLACEYVLGTLRGAARRRFEGVLAGHIPLRRAVQQWEQRLFWLSMRLPPVKPPAHLWTQIEQRLNLSQNAPPPDATRPSRVWQALAAGIAAIALTLGVLLVTRAPEVQVQVQKQAVESAHTAIVAEGNVPIWVLNAYPQVSELRVKALRPVALADNQAFELWMLPDSGAPPVSLGLLPRSGNAVLPLSAAAARVLAATSTLAVSIEPAGGSPTGAPTGPVRYTAPLLHIAA
jgi:anti-sigma-K factor RskA